MNIENQSANNVLLLLPYPQSTFEALLVKTVNWGDDLEELVDALLVVEVGKLLEGLLDLLPQSLCLETVTREREREGEKKREFRRLKRHSGDEARCELIDVEPVTGRLPSPTVKRPLALPNRLSRTRNPTWISAAANSPD